MKNGTITVITSNGVKYVLDHELACVSKTIKMFINPIHPFIQSETKIINLPFNSKTFERCIEFMNHKLHKTNEFYVKDDEVMELLDVASYLRL